MMICENRPFVMVLSQYQVYLAVHCTAEVVVLEVKYTLKVRNLVPAADK